MCVCVCVCERERERERESEVFADFFLDYALPEKALFTVGSASLVHLKRFFSLLSLPHFFTFIHRGRREKEEKKVSSLLSKLLFAGGKLKALLFSILLQETDKKDAEVAKAAYT